MNLTSAAIEAAAKASYDAGAYCGECYYEGWGECSVCHSLNMGYARAALEAAEPHMCLDRHSQRTEWPDIPRVWQKSI